MKVVLVAINAKFSHSSLAVYSLQKACLKSGREIVIKEYSINNQLLTILADVFAAQPEVICLTCYLWNIQMMTALTGMLKQVLPSTIIVWGGPEVSYDGQEQMRLHEEIDYLIQGEGEVVLAALLDVLARQKLKPGLQATEFVEMAAAIHGLLWRNQNQIIVNRDLVTVAIDSLPFPYAEIDLPKLKDKIIYYESSRGCPFSCSYCLSSVSKGVRCRSLAKVLTELQFFISNDVKQVKFVDRTFNADKRHYFPIWRFLARQNCQTNFHFEIAADLLDEEVLDFLQTVPAKRFQFEIGVQSTYEPALRAISRKNDWAKIAAVVKRLRAYDNIHLHLDLIAGLPWEDIAAFAVSFNQVYELQPHMLQLGFLKMLKGCRIRTQAQEHEYAYMSAAPYEVLANKYMSYRELRKLKLLEDILAQVYNSGRFPYALPWLVQICQKDAFHFFTTLTDYWEEQGWQQAAHSPQTLFVYLQSFVQAKYPQVAIQLAEILKFDALLGKGGMLQIAELPWNEQEPFCMKNTGAGDKGQKQELWVKAKNDFWRNTTTVQKYVPDYRFTTWRELHKKYHLEVFSQSIAALLAFSSKNEVGTEPGEQKKGEFTAVLFVLPSKLQQASWQVIAANDFFAGSCGKEMAGLC